MSLLNLGKHHATQMQWIENADIETIVTNRMCEDGLGILLNYAWVTYTIRKYQQFAWININLSQDHKWSQKKIFSKLESSEQSDHQTNPRPVTRQSSETKIIVHNIMIFLILIYYYMFVKIVLYYGFHKALTPNP